MEVSDCVDAALTRARQARLPSPWTGRGIWKSGSQTRWCCAWFLIPAQDSDTHVRSVEFFCHSRARVWRARGIANSAGGRGEGPGFFARQPRARMTEQERARPEL